MTHYNSDPVCHLAQCVLETRGWRQIVYLFGFELWRDPLTRRWHTFSGAMDIDGARMRHESAMWRTTRRAS